MAIEIKMPRMSDTMESGTLVKWNVAEGDTIESGQALADIETDKATMEMPAYDGGVVAKIVAAEGATVSVGETLMIVAEEGESVEDALASVEAGSSTSSAGGPGGGQKESVGSGGADGGGARAKATSAPATSPSGPRGGGSIVSHPQANGSGDQGGRLLVSPLARRIAEEHGIDLNTVSGSGPNGRIVKRDVMAVVAGQAPRKAGQGLPTTPVAQSGGALALAPPAPAVGALGGRIEMSNMRQTIARRLVESKTTIPHYQVSMNVEADALVKLRETLNDQLASQGVKLSLNDFLIRGCALAIHQHPMFNGVWGGDHVEIGPRVNIGMAVALPEERGGGLVVATIFDADRKGLRQIAMEAKALAMKARTRGLSLEEMSGTTFTISNLGMFGTDSFTAIINPPNVAILAVGAAIRKPVVRDDELTIGYEMNCTLSCDHRVIDGATGAQFLVTLKNMLENPATLLV